MVGLNDFTYSICAPSFRIIKSYETTFLACPGIYESHIGAGSINLNEKDREYMPGAYQPLTHSGTE